MVSHLPTHRVWGLSAATGYGCAAISVHRLPWPRARTAALVCALAGAVIVPLTYLVLTGAQQSEVGVIERSGALMLHQGTPYLAHPHTAADYTPYLPGMALFGVARALLGADHWALRVLSDARLCCALVLLICLEAGRRMLDAPSAARPARGGRLPYGTALAALIASPPVALPLSVSGVDLPLTGLCCLALACATRGRPVATGLALAAACSLKWTALPAVAVAVALLGRTRGSRVAVRCVATAMAGTVLLVLPSFLLSPQAMVEQALAFPTGRGGVPTPADSPLPGRLLADLGPVGWYAAVGLLLLGALAVGASLLLWPPLGLASAAQRLAVGLCVGFLLAPVGRFGYLGFPVVLVAWSRQVAPERPARTVRRDAARPCSGTDDAPTDRGRLSGGVGPTAVAGPVIEESRPCTGSARDRALAGEAHRRPPPGAPHARPPRPPGRHLLWPPRVWPPRVWPLRVWPLRVWPPRVWPLRVWPLRGSAR
ncbi:glycosyltransferase 87 family protein [Streptomyces sp. NPDC004752]